MTRSALAIGRALRDVLGHAFSRPMDEREERACSLLAITRGIELGERVLGGSFSGPREERRIERRWRRGDALRHGTRRDCRGLRIDVRDFRRASGDEDEKEGPETERAGQPHAMSYVLFCAVS